MDSKYCLFVYDPETNETRYNMTHTSKEVLIHHAHTYCDDKLMFSIYKFKGLVSLTMKGTPANKWVLDTKFDGKNVLPSYKNFNHPMRCAYKIVEEYYISNDFFFKTS